MERPGRDGTLPRGLQPEHPTSSQIWSRVGGLAGNSKLETGYCHPHLRNPAALYFIDSPLPTPYPQSWRTMPGRSPAYRRLHWQLETVFPATVQASFRHFVARAGTNDWVSGFWLWL